MTKEEILNKVRDDSKFACVNEVVFSVPEAKEAMEEYAKQQAIAFGEWIDKYKMYKFDGLWHRSNWPNESPFTDEQLYNQFIESQQKP